jgi:hypothetical protein
MAKLLRCDQCSMITDAEDADLRGWVVTMAVTHCPGDEDHAEHTKEVELTFCGWKCVAEYANAAATIGWSTVDGWSLIGGNSIQRHDRSFQLDQLELGTAVADVSSTTVYDTRRDSALARQA